MANEADLAKRWVAIARKLQPTIVVTNTSVTITQGSASIKIPIGKPAINSTNNIRNR